MVEYAINRSASGDLCIFEDDSQQRRRYLVPRALL